MTGNTNSRERWLKAELHTHCNLDPEDYWMCRYSPEQLILRAAQLGYEVLSITCHNTDIWTDDLSDFARNLGLILIPGMEVDIERTRHILVYNFNTGPENLNTIEKIRDRSREDTLVIAPHAFFPTPSCLGRLLGKNLDVFDAIEFSGFHVRGLDFNRRSVNLARKAGKPLIACADIHFLWQLDRTFTWIYAEPNPQAVLNSIKQGSLRIQAAPLSWMEAAGWWAATLWSYAFPAKPVPTRLNQIKDRRCFGTAQQRVKS